MQALKPQEKEGRKKKPHEIGEILSMDIFSGFGKKSHSGFSGCPAS
jgi:hypothetical protein